MWHHMDDECSRYSHTGMGIFLIWTPRPGPGPGTWDKGPGPGTEGPGPKAQVILYQLDSLLISGGGCFFANPLSEDLESQRLPRDSGIDPDGI